MVSEVRAAIRDQLRRKRSYMADKWHLDEVAVTIKGLTVLKGVSNLGYQITSFHPASSFEGQSPDGDALLPCHHKG